MTGQLGTILYTFWFLMKKFGESWYIDFVPSLIFSFKIAPRGFFSQISLLPDDIVPSCLRSLMALCLVGIAPRYFCSYFVLFQAGCSYLVLFQDVPAAKPFLDNLYFSFTYMNFVIDFFSKSKFSTKMSNKFESI